MQQTNLFFDVEEAESRKQEGMERAADNHLEVLRLAQEFVERAGVHQRIMTVDDAQDYLLEMGYSPADLGKAAGKIFDPAKWRCVGYVNSRRTTNNRRTIKQWTLRNK